MIYEEPELVSDIFECVGSRLLSYYENALNLKALVQLWRMMIGDSASKQCLHQMQ